MKKKFNIFQKIEEGFVAFLLVGSTVLLFANVIMRKYLNSSTTWTEEAIRYAIIWVTFIGGGICVRNKLHVGIDIVVENSPPKLQKIFKILSNVFSATFSFMLAFFGYQNMSLVLETNQLSSALRLPMWIIYLAIPLGCISMGIRYLIEIYKIVKNNNKENDILDLSKY